VTFSLVSAQIKKAQPEIPAKPEFTSELRELSFLVGSFATDIKVHKTPLTKAGPGKGTVICQWVLDSTFLLFNFDEISPAGRFRGHGYLTFDKPEKKYRMWWFNNQGEGLGLLGDFVRDTLILQGESQSKDKIVGFKFLWHKQGEKLVMRVMGDFGEGLKPVLERTSQPLEIGEIKTNAKKQKLEIK